MKKTNNIEIKHSEKIWVLLLCLKGGLENEKL